MPSPPAVSPAPPDEMTEEDATLIAERLEAYRTGRAPAVPYEVIRQERRAKRAARADRVA